MRNNVQAIKGKESVIAGVVVLVAIVILHQPQWSLQNLLIGDNALTISGMAFAKLLVGFLTSVIVLAICALVIRKPSSPTVAIATAVQVLWVEFEWNFSIRTADAGELMVRFAEEVGIVVAGSLLILIFTIRRRGYTT